MQACAFRLLQEVSQLIKEINEIVADRQGEDSPTHDVISASLTPASASVFNYLPPPIRAQLLLDRDPHGNVQVKGSSCHCPDEGILMPL